MKKGGGRSGREEIRIIIRTCTRTIVSEEEKNFTQSFGKNNLSPQQPMRCTLGSVLIYCDVFLNKLFSVRKLGHRIN